MHLDVESRRIKNSASNADADREGVRLEMTGSRDPFEPPKGGQKGIKQKATIELICNKDKTGWEPGKDPKGEKKSRKRDDDGDDKHEDEDDDKHENQDGDNGGSPADDGAALKFLKYERESTGNEEWDVLRLEWETKYACEDAVTNKPSTEGWGFFTWLLIMYVCLLT
jgi:autophagy-related protein 27